VSLDLTTRKLYNFNHGTIHNSTNNVKPPGRERTIENIAAVRESVSNVPSLSIPRRSQQLKNAHFHNKFALNALLNCVLFHG